MEIDNATKDFLEALNKDQGMQERMGTALAGAVNPRQAAVDFAIAEGFRVTAASLDAAREAIGATSDLSDSELESVSGGFNPQPEPPARNAPSNTTLPAFDPKLTNSLLRW